jgi:hypothetical protein
LEKLMRNWDLARLATVAEIGASIGVLISVIYLGIQIQGSNKQLRAQSYNDTLEMLHKPLELIVQDQGLADIVVRAETDPESLSQGEWQRYSYLLLLRFNAYEHAYYAHMDAEIREEIWKGIESGLTGTLASNKGFRKFWTQKGRIFPEPFHGFVESKLGDEP